MGWLSRKLEEKRLRLLAAARRGAFESYMRHGRVPEAYSRIAAVASEAKALNTDVSLDALEPSRLPAGRPTTHYVWRTAGDGRVRGSHVARNGQIFAWVNPPEHGHPGHEPNCRCWPEPYYGNPAVPDALLKMVRERRVNTDPDVLWASIDTVTRPDGSLAASEIVMNDGAVVRSSFRGREVQQVITSPVGMAVRIARHDGRQSVYVGGDPSPVVRSTWQNGPVITRTRERVAFQKPLDPFASQHPMLDVPGGPGGPSPTALGAGGALAAVLALLELYNQQVADPTSLGASESDVAFVAFKAWAVDAKPADQLVPVPVASGTLSDEQLRESCERLAEVQEWTDAAARELAYLKPLLSAANWGSVVHKKVKDIIDALKSATPGSYADVFAELSLTMNPDDGVFYSQKGSIRVDVAEDRTAETGAVCVYDIKTGKEGLTPKRLIQIARFVAKNYGAVIFYIVEVRPQE